MKELFCLEENPHQVGKIDAEMLAGVLATIFSRGMALKEALQVKLTRRHRKRYLNHFILGGSEKNKNIWLGNGDLFSSHSRLDLKAKSQTLRKEASSQVVLPMRVWVVGILNRAFEKRIQILAGSDKIVGQRFFVGKEQEYKDAVNIWLKNVRDQYPNERSTLTRINQYIRQVGYQMPDVDLSEATYIHGNVHPVAETQLYYTAISQQRIQAIYNSIWEKVEHNIEEERKAQKDEVFLPRVVKQKEMVPLAAGPNYLGSRIAPTIEAVRSLCAHLTTKLDQVSKSPPRWRETIEHHNAYVLYTAMMLAYSSGYRAIQDPLPDPRWIDISSGFGVISDKDPEDNYCTREVWLPEACVEQIWNSTEHLDRLAIRLTLIESKSFRDLLNSMKEWAAHDPTDRRNRKADNTFPPILFVLDQSGRCKALTPSWLKEQIVDVFSLPLNGNRHFLRTSLVERGCPKDITDAFIGHWQRGREPWGRHSSLSPITYARIIGRYIRDLLQDTGWSPIKGIEV